jgi:dinuclear metal center YbgI/SA1388 family protein
MITVANLCSWLETFAPLALAESWDNVGLLWGDPRTRVKRVMTCLTVTTATSNEAIREGAELVVSHHPVLFRAAKRVRADDAKGAMLLGLARAGTAVYSPHTAFDNTVGGINDTLAELLGLRDVCHLRPAAARGQFKVVVFTPNADREAVLAAAFRAGAGEIGDYRECSFSTPGRGTFFGTEGTNPAIGQTGRRETVREWKIEIVCAASQLSALLHAVRASHSYEEPAIDVIPLHAEPAGPGPGRVGRLPKAMRLVEFASKVAKAFHSRSVQTAGDLERMVERIAIACGAGDDFIGDAARADADVLLTGEARFHQALEATELGLALVLAGHHATERPGVEALAARLGDAFPKLVVWASKDERDPLVAASEHRPGKK